MQFQIQNLNKTNSKAQSLVYFVSQKGTGDQGMKLNNIPKDLQKIVKDAEKDEVFKGEWSSTLSFRGMESQGGKNITFIGLGPEKEFTAEKARQASANAYKYLSALKTQSAVIFADGLVINKNKNADIARAAAEGVTLASYNFDTLKNMGEKKSKKKTSKAKELNIELGMGDSSAGTKKAFEQGTIIGEATNFTRWLGDMPGNRMNPKILAEETVKAAKGTKLKVTVWDKARIKKENMGSFLSVSLGSDAEPRFIMMEYKGAAASKKPICYVGKGLTFDAGGISLKPSAGMEEMKYDMCGGASVIGTMIGIAKLGLKVNVIAFVPATENMPGPSANKPGDVVQARNGKTIEVNNTDAEGRLILADALTYAAEKKPVWICDAATLTGAMVVALGNIHTGFYTSDDAVAKKVEKAAEESGERVWRMPVVQDHQDDMKGTYADLSNLASSRGAGSATAAAFLKNFVPEEVPYAHFDVAGTAWNAGNRLSYNPKKGATGSIVRTFIQMAMDHKA